VSKETLAALVVAVAVAVAADITVDDSGIVLVDHSSGCSVSLVLSSKKVEHPSLSAKPVVEMSHNFGVRYISVSNSIH
jgi:hypothetical protein